MREDLDEILNSLHELMLEAGFHFEGRQQAHSQNRGYEHKYVHPELVDSLERAGVSATSLKYYLKALSDESDAEVGLTTGKTSPLHNHPEFPPANARDSHSDSKAWTNRTGERRLDELLQAITRFTANS
ncbi:MAG: hypothetical protein ACO4B3_03575 [Planctomycetota bacterium]